MSWKLCESSSQHLSSADRVFLIHFDAEKTERIEESQLKMYLGWFKVFGKNESIKNLNNRHKAQMGVLQTQLDRVSE